MREKLLKEPNGNCGVEKYITEMKNFTRGVNSRFELAEEITNELKVDW